MQHYMIRNLQNISPFLQKKKKTKQILMGHGKP